MIDQIKGGLIWVLNIPIWLDMGTLSPNANAKKVHDVSYLSEFGLLHVFCCNVHGR